MIKFLVVFMVLSLCGSVNAAEWHNDYYAAYREADRDHKQLLIFFKDNKQKLVVDSYQRVILVDKTLEGPLKTVVRVVLPIDVEVGGRQLLDYPAFKHQNKRHGIVVLDLVDSESKFYGRAVSCHPFNLGRHYTVQSTKVVIELPRGTITQRSMVYAARMHPNRPAGAMGEATTKLMSYAQTHSGTMARNRSMYHSSYSHPEIVAYSGGSSTIIDTAKSFITMWRNSPGHWNILSSGYRNCGFDMKRSGNQWYATGIFGN